MKWGNSITNNELQVILDSQREVSNGYDYRWMENANLIEGKATWVCPFCPDNFYSYWRNKLEKKGKVQYATYIK